MDFGDLLVLCACASLGLFGHFLSKVAELRGDTPPTMKRYFLDHFHESLGSIVAVAIGLMMLIEMGEATPFQAATLGYISDSLVNKFRNRAAR